MENTSIRNTTALTVLFRKVRMVGWSLKMKSGWLLYPVSVSLQLPSQCHDNDLPVGDRKSPHHCRPTFSTTLVWGSYSFISEKPHKKWNRFQPPSNWYWKSYNSPILLISCLLLRNVINGTASPLKSKSHRQEVALKSCYGCCHRPSI